LFRILAASALRLANSAVVIVPIGSAMTVREVRTMPERTRAK
jgi:hypothetical protein